MILKVFSSYSTLYARFLIEKARLIVIPLRFIKIIKMVQTPHKAFLLVVLIGMASALTTYTNTVSLDASSTFIPTYSLGIPALNNVYEFTITTPNNGQTVSMLTIGFLSGITPVVPPSLPTPPTLLATDTTYHWTWTVTAADVLLAITDITISRTLPLTTGDPIVVYYLTVVLNGILVHNYVDIGRNHIVKYIYSATAQDLTQTQTALNDMTYNLAPLLSYDQYTVGTPVLTGAAGPSNTFAAANVLVGYHAFYFQGGTASAIYTLTHQTDPYICPYIFGFNDAWNVFQGCSQVRTLPFCIHTSSNGTCTSCSPGYALISGQCGTPYQLCGARRYAMNGNCNDVKPTCNTFDAFSGKCYTCQDPAVNPDSNGVCAVSLASTIVCAAGTHEYNLTCIPDECKAAFVNGSCFECINTAYLLNNATGVCGAVGCGVGNYFSVALNQCTPLPSQCATYNLILQVCTACSTGYFIDPTDHSCVQPVGSANCLKWDFRAAKCSQCDNGYLWELNMCRMTGASVVPCPSGKILVGLFCINLPPHCLSLNIHYHCIQCVNGYRLQAGDCVKCTGNNAKFPCVTCPATHKIDNLGRCVSNTNNSNNGGQTPVTPVDFNTYYRYCRIYNPSTKICETCVSNRNFDYADHCA